jgi:hypothetical protein
MRAWTEAVTDRNRLDLIGRTPKAYLHASDLNRIESNIAYLSDRLGKLGYSIQVIAEKDWCRDDIPKIDDMRHICDSIVVITQAYYIPDVYTDISDIPDRALHYSDVNDIEKNLSSVKDLIERGATHSYLRRYTHEELNMLTYAQIRRGDIDFPA